jgi:hypothetical protein
MIGSTAVRWMAGAVMAIAVLGVLRFKPWAAGAAAGSEEARKKVTIGFLPVT